jgi:hypothetical protein
MRLAMRTLMLGGCVLFCAAGCKVVEPRAQGHSPLVSLSSGSEQLTLEVFSAPVPLADPRLETLWSEVDEQSLASELRRDLHQNGLRVGIVGPHLPDPLAEMLKITDTRVQERSLVALDPEPGVVLRVLQPRIGHRQELRLGEPRDQVTILRSHDGQVDGKCYQKAECLLALRVMGETDGRVRLELVPELHHGEMKAHAVGSEGVFIWKPERAKQVYHDLKIATTLGPGQMIVLTWAPERQGSIGQAFFVQQGGEKPMQKLWVIRVAQAGADRSFADAVETASEEVSSDAAE